MKDFARQQTLERLEVLSKALGTGTVDSDAIHHVRVAGRRFLQCLRSFRQRLDRHAAAKMRRRIHKLLQLCGAVRDREIALHLLEDAGLGKKSRAVKALSVERHHAQDRLEKEWKRWSKKSILRDWPKRLFSGEAVNRKVDPELAAMTAALFEQGQAATAPGSSYREMHRFRLGVKRYRYTVELFSPRYGARAVKGVLAGLRELQDCLGAMNDCVSALELLPGQGRARTLLRGMLMEREHVFRSHWKQHFGTRRRNQWTSIFCATVKRNLAPPPLRKQPARSPRRDAKTSAA